MSDRQPAVAIPGATAVGRPENDRCGFRIRWLREISEDAQRRRLTMPDVLREWIAQSRGRRVFLDPGVQPVVVMHILWDLGGAWWTWRRRPAAAADGSACCGRSDRRRSQRVGFGRGTRRCIQGAGRA